MTKTYYDRVKMSLATAPGTGTLTLATAVPGFQSFAGASVPNGATLSYVIEDGTNYEYGTGTYNSSAGTLTRTTVLGSSSGGTTPITASASAIVYTSFLAEDVAALVSSIAALHSVPAGGTTGQALTKNSDTDYDAGWSTVSGGGGGGGSEPWYWSPPTAATFNVDLNDGTAANIEDDSDVGMQLYINGTPALGDRIRIKGVAIAPAGDWTVTTHIIPQIPDVSYCTAGLALWKAGQSNVCMFGAHFGGGPNTNGAGENEICVNRYSQSGTGFTDTGYVLFVRGDAKHLKITYTAGTDTLTFYVSYCGKRWLLLGTETATSYLGGGADHIGFGIAPNNTQELNYGDQTVTVDRWVTTGF